jgi:hypothetical protein
MWYKNADSAPAFCRATQSIWAVHLPTFGLKRALEGENYASRHAISS